MRSASSVNKYSALRLADKEPISAEINFGHTQYDNTSVMSATQRLEHSKTPSQGSKEGRRREGKQREDGRGGEERERKKKRKREGSREIGKKYII